MDMIFRMKFGDVRIVVAYVSEILSVPFRADVVGQNGGGFQGTRNICPNLEMDHIAVHT